MPYGGVPTASFYHHRFPGIDADEDEVMGFVVSHFADQQVLRNYYMSEIARNILYTLGQQWIEPDVDANQLYGTDGARGFFWRGIQQNADVERPTPVDNRITSAIDVEFATLAKRQWQPKVPTFYRDPRLEASAKVAGDILKDRLRKLLWDDVRDSFIRNTILHGTGIIKSFWDESFARTMWIATSEPYRCPACHEPIANRAIPLSLINMISNGTQATIADVEGEDRDGLLMNCPFCASASPLEPTELSEDEAQKKDLFGQPLGEEVPRGDTNIELFTPFEYYPQASGVDHTPKTLTEHYFCKVRSVDWVMDHYPNLSDEPEPEPPEELLRYHPLLGTQYYFLGRFNPSYDAALLGDHVRVYELYAEPSRRMPEGRSVVMIGRRQRLLAENGPLVKKFTDDRTGETVQVKKVCVAVSIWKPQDGLLWGRGLPCDIISPQNRINGIDCQTIEARERMGSPNLLSPRDANLSGPEYDAAYGAGKFFTYDLSALNPNAKPEVFGSILMPSGVNVEREIAESSITKIIGPADIEIGEAPRNVTTTSGLQILGEQAERRRGTRERSLTSAFQKIWEHQLQLLWVLRVDEDTYEATTPDGMWEVKQYDRKSIAGHTKVEIEKQAYIDKSIVQREAAREALVDGLYGPPQMLSPLARKRMLEIRGLPTDINEEANIQIDHAKRVWVDFVDDGKVPVVDPSLHDPAIRFQVLGFMLSQDEGLQLSEEAGWPDILPFIAGWEDVLAAMSQADAQARQIYGPDPDPEQANEQFAKLTESYLQAKLLYEQAQQATQNLPPGGPQPPPQEPPQPPVPPTFIPRQLEARIFLVWQSMLEKRNVPTQWADAQARKTMRAPEEILDRLEKFLRFRAVVEAYRLMAGPMAAPGSMPQGQPPAPPQGQPGPGGPQPPAPPPPPTPGGQGGQ